LLRRSSLSLPQIVLRHSSGATLKPTVASSASTTNPVMKLARVEAAEKLSITLETARSYSKTIYTKNGAFAARRTSRVPS